MFNHSAFQAANPDELQCDSPFVALVHDIGADKADDDAVKEKQIGSDAQACKATQDYDEYGAILWVVSKTELAAPLCKLVFRW